MKKLFLLLCFCLVETMYGLAQVTVEEPIFADQVLLLTSDNNGVLLPRENAMVKTKARTSLYLVGMGKVKTRLTVPHSESSVTAPNNNVRLIVKAKDNLTDPTSFINIFQFKVKSNRRQYLLSQLGSFSGAAEKSLNSVTYHAKTYKDSCYYIMLDNLPTGQYGIIIGTLKYFFTTFVFV